jgi:hypothetical protein
MNFEKVLGNRNGELRRRCIARKQISFPEVVGKLLAAGVEYYHVDYVGRW